MNTNNPITPFLFGESIIRTKFISGLPWFSAKDVCECLGIANSRDAVSALHASEKITVGNTDGKKIVSIR